MSHPLDPLMLLRGYAAGIFPMADARDAPDIFWVEPRRRAILPLDGFHLSRSLAKTIRQDRFRVSRDEAFEAVLHACADRGETWINATIEKATLGLHRAGHAHSIECWDGDRLVGGLYGVKLGGAFFGESMFSRETDASKVALAWLVARLRIGQFRLLDCQFITGHLASLGATEVRRDTYVGLLGSALSAGRGEAGAAGSAGAVVGALAAASPFAADDAAADPLPDFFALDTWLATSGAVTGAPGQAIVQLLTQTS